MRGVCLSAGGGTKESAGRGGGGGGGGVHQATDIQTNGLVQQSLDSSKTNHVANLR